MSEEMIREEELKLKVGSVILGLMIILGIFNIVFASL